MVATSNNNDNFCLLNPIQEGPAAHQRIGRDIKMKSVRITGIAKCESRTTESGSNYFGNCLRMVVIYDETPGDTFPDWNTVFEGVGPGGGIHSNQWAQPSIQNGERFTVLRDITFYAAPMAALGAGGFYTNFVHIDEYIKLKDARTRFKSTAAPITTANIGTGALYLVWRAEKDDYPVSTSWYIQPNMFSRIRYYDP